MQVEPRQYVGAVDEGLVDDDIGLDLRQALDSLPVVIGIVRAAEKPDEGYVVGQH